MAEADDGTTKTKTVTPQKGASTQTAAALAAGTLADSQDVAAQDELLRRIRNYTLDDHAPRSESDLVNPNLHQGRQSRYNAHEAGRTDELPVVDSPPLVEMVGPYGRTLLSDQIPSTAGNAADARVSRAAYPTDGLTDAPTLPQMSGGTATPSTDTALPLADQNAGPAQNVVRPSSEPFGFGEGAQAKPAPLSDAPTSAQSTTPQPAPQSGTSAPTGPSAMHLSASFVVEDTAPGSIVAQLSADGDGTGAYSYALVSDPSGWFEIVGDTLRVRAGVTVDYEQLHDVPLVLRVTDSQGLSLDSRIELAISNINDETPDSLTASSLSVAENSAAGTVVATLAAHDADAGDVLSYSLASDPNGLFEVVGNELRVKAGAVLDHETLPSATIVLRVTDAAGHTLDRTFTIGINDSNEGPTAIALSANHVAENAAGATIGTLTTTDPDAGESFTYSVSDSRFEVVGGALKLKAGVSLDHEAEPSVAVTVTSTDHGGLATTQAFTVTVDDVNEGPTAIALSANHVAENAAGATIGTLTTTDPDAGESFTYSVSDSRFEVVGGALKLKAGVSLDHEAEPTVAVTVTSTDQGGLSTSQNFTVSVDNANEGPTAIALSANHVAENAAGATIGTLTTTDPDAGESFTYSVSDSRFEVVGGALKLKAGVSLDHEAEPTVAVTVTSTDQGGLSTSQNFTVSVDNANEGPTAIALSANHVAENAAGATIGTLTTTDPDAGESFTYSVSDSRFEVVGGALKLKAGVSLDHEAEPTVAVTVTSTDQGGLSTSQNFTVSVDNANEGPTAIALSANHVAENAAGATIGTLTTTDPDAGESFTYSVSDSRFEVVGGALKLKAGVSLDHEAEPTVAVTVTSTDQGGLSTSQNFTVSVDNANEGPTAIALSANHVAENAAGATIGTLTTTDPDAGESFTYSVSDSRFEVVGGALKLKAGVSLDHEAEPNVAVTVTSTDQGGLSTSQSFTVSVDNANEGPTAIALSANHVAENAAGATIGTLTTTDPDAGESFTYSVSDSRFEVVGGALKLKAGVSLDHEAEPNVAVTVISTDQGGLSTSQNFTVSVDNANEGPTAIALSANHVAENAAGATIGTLTTTDPDAGESFTYSVSDSRFEVVGGALKLKAGVSLDHEAEPNVAVTVTSTDQGGLSTSQSFTVSVDNANEGPTAIALSANHVAENAAGATIGTLTTTDPDAGESFTYSVSDSRFEVVGGALKLKAGVSLDHEAEPNVAVTVTSTDHGGLATTQAFTVTVDDVNEGPTAIALSANHVAENAAGATIGTLTTTDPDAGESFTYSVSDSRFEVVGGALKLKAGVSLDHEAEPNVAVTVTSTDQGGLSTSQSFTVSVDNANEGPTAIALSANHVAENAAGATIGTLTTTDPDAGESFTYSVSDSRFEVVGGALKLKAGVSLDHEAEPNVAVTVISTDQGGLSTSQNFTVSVDNANEGPTAIALSANHVAENAAGATIGTLTTTDPDAGESFTYSVSDSRFEVVGGALKLKAGVSLDHEAEPNVAVTVTSTDQGGLSTSQSFTVSVDNANEGPTAIALSANHVAENAAGATIGTLTTTDPDAGESFTYSVSDSRFEVVGGALKLKAGVSLDHEAEPNVAVTVTSTDQGGLSTSQSFTVSVDDVNEGPTAIVLSANHVAENAAGATIGTLTTTDPDAGESFTYSVSDSRFEVVGGALKLKAGVSLDHEAEPNVAVTVTSTDQGGLSTSQSFTVSVDNANEGPTAIALSANHVAENAAGATIGTLTTTDPDAGESFTYSVSDSRFEVVGGALKLKAGSSLDYVSEHSVNLTVTSTDHGGLSTTQSFTVQVDDNINTITGTNGDDLLVGTTGNDLIQAAGGNDTVVATTGGDTYVGGAGSDTLSFTNAASAVTANLGTTTAQATGSDFGTVTQSGFENLTGGTGNDSLTGDASANSVDGGAGADTIIATAGGDTLTGGTGTDTLSFTNAASAVTANLGTTTAQATGADFGTITQSGFENLTGGTGNDSLTGNANANSITGGAGADTIRGGGGNDTIDGGTGTDTLAVTGAHTDYSFTLNADGTVTVTDTRVGSPDGTETLTSIEQITFSDGTYSLNLGTTGNDSLTASGNVIELGGAGNDTLTGGTGTDILIGGGGTDTISYSSDTTGVTVNLAASSVSGGNAAGDTISGFTNIVGGAGDDRLIGDTNTNSIDGGAGNDTILLTAGGDTINGGSGNNTLDVSAFTTAGATINLAVTTAQNTGSYGTTTISNMQNVWGSAYGDSLTGDSGANYLYGNAGNDTLSGGAGNDSVFGGTGNDVIDGGTDTDIAVYTGAHTDYSFTLNADGTVTVTDLRNGSPDGTDTLTSIEQLSFSDGTYTLNLGTTGNDSLTASGNAIELGGAGNDTLTSGTGTDILVGGSGTDTLSYDSDTTGVSVLLYANSASGGNANGDTISGFTNLISGSGNDILAGNGSANSIDAGAGNDTIVATVGNSNGDTYDGGAGNDTLDIYNSGGASVTVNLGTTTAQATGAFGSITLTNVENIYSGLSDNVLTGSSGANTITLMGGNNTVDGGGGADTIIAIGTGNDRITERGGEASIDAGAGTDTLVLAAGSGVTSVNLASATDQTTGDAGSVKNFENLDASAMTTALNISGSTGANTITGGSGNDTVTASAGGDTYVGGAGSDTLSFGNAASAVTANLGTTTAQATGTDFGAITQSGFENLTGGAGNDSLTGDASANSIAGGVGADTIRGGGGNDTIDGGSGTDTLVVTGAHTDYSFTLNADGTVTVVDTRVGSPDGTTTLSSIEQITFSDGTYTLNLGTSGNDSLTASGNTIELGGAGNDTLTGGSGTDILIGGGGTDTLSYGSDTTGVTINLASDAASGGNAAGDTISGFANVIGGSGNDSLTGNASANSFDGGAGVDTIIATAGGDTYVGGAGNDTLSFGNANAGVSFNANTTTTQNTGTNGIGSVTASGFETIVGSGYADTIYGASSGSVDGGAGNDKLYAATDSSNVTLSGGDGNDTLSANSTSGVVMIGGTGSDTFTGNNSDTTVSYASSGAAITVNMATGTNSGGDAAGDTLNDINTVVGSAYDDYIRLSGSDGLYAYGGDGNDTMTAIAGDTIDGGSGWNTYDKSWYGGASVINMRTGQAYATAYGFGTNGSLGVTFSNFNAAIGTDYADSIIADDLGDSLMGGAGNDTITGGTGRDTIDGGTGDDTIIISGGGDVYTGGAGTDTLSFANATSAVTTNLAITGAQTTGSDFGTITQSGFENLTGGTGNDLFTGDANANSIDGGAGNDTIIATAGGDTYTGGAGTDTLSFASAASSVTANLATTGAQATGSDFGNITQSGFENLTGGTGNDSLTGNTSANSIDGGAGNDTIIATAGGDTYTGGAGTDTLSFANAGAAVTANLGTTASQATGSNFGTITQSGFENLIGGTGNDSLTGDVNANSIDGGAGADTIYGNGGNDTIDGGTGTDTLVVTGAHTDYSFTLNADGTVTDTRVGSPDGTETLTSVEKITFSDGTYTLTLGTTGNDSLTASGNTIELGGTGNDTLTGGTGTDILIGGGGTDTLSYGSDTTGVTLNLASNTASGGNAAGDTISGFSNVIGGTGNDSITGNASANSIDGGTGNDTITASAGGDTYVGGTGTDTLSFANAASTVTANLATTTAQATGSDFGTITQSGFENLTGGTGNDSLSGDANANSIDGGTGNDTIVASAGGDAYVGGTGTDTLTFANAASAVTANLGTTTAQATGSDFGTITQSGFETLIGGVGNDSLTGDSSANSIDGGAGNDTIVATAGGDTLVGGTGTDTLSFANAASAITANLGTTTAQATGTDFGTVTQSGFENLTGGTGNDSLTGDANANSIAGGTGDDTIIASRGNDTVDGGTGNDTLVLSKGSWNYAFWKDSAGDTYIVDLDLQQNGSREPIKFSNIENLQFTDQTVSTATIVYGSDTTSDSMSGGTGNDVMSGGGGDDTMNGGAGNDLLIGNAGNNTLIGGAGNDTLVGDTGADSMSGGTGNDVIFGFMGNDTIEGGAGADTLDGGIGTNTLSYADDTTGVTVNLATGAASGGDAASDVIANFQNLIGGSGNDLLTGDANANSIVGGAGDDTLIGGAGADTLDGGTGNNTVDYSGSAAGVSVLLQNTDGLGAYYLNTAAGGIGGDAQGDVYANIQNVVGSANADYIYGGATSGSYQLGAGNDLFDTDGTITAHNYTIDAGTGNDTVWAGAGNDVIYGGVGNDSLRGEDGNDTIEGGAGADTLNGGNGTDTLSFAGDTTGVTVNIGTNTASGGDAASDVISNFENLTGGSGNDSLTGSSTANSIDGGAGNDTIVATAGGDTYTGGAGTDTIDLSGSGSAVTLNLATNTAQATGGFGSVTQSGFENITGSSYNDSLTGDSGDNTILGGAGNDTIYGDSSSANLLVNASFESYTGTEIHNVANGTYGWSNGGDTTIETWTSGYNNQNASNGSYFVELDNGLNVDSLYQDVTTTAGQTYQFNFDYMQRSGYAASTQDFQVYWNGVLVGEWNAGSTSWTTAYVTVTGTGGSDRIEFRELSTENDSTGILLDNTALVAVGNDYLDGGAGADSINGGGGNDTVMASAGGDTYVGGLGNDTLSFANATAGVNFNANTTTSQNTGNNGIGYVTASGFETIVGSAYTDTMYGATGDYVDGGAGNDMLYAASGSSDVTLSGGAGNDTLSANHRSGVVMIGGAGSDIFNGNGSDSTVSYATSGAAVTINLTSNTYSGGDAAGDTLNSINSIVGSDYDDYIRLNTGGDAEYAYGGAGNDTMLGGSNDTMDGGAGDNMIDFSWYSAAATINVSTGQAYDSGNGSSSSNVNFSNFDQVTGTSYSDRITADDNGDLIYGGAGNDTITGGAGNDTILGGAGNDSLIGGAGTDTLSYADAGSAVTVNFASGLNPAVTGGGGTDTISGFENLTGSNYNDSLTGDANANVINGGAGNDTINAAAGNDTVTAGYGSDSIDGGAGTDTLDYSNVSGAVSVNFTTNTASHTGTGAGTDTVTNFEAVIGSSGNDTITGNASASTTMSGGAGNDSMTGGTADDVFIGGLGNDTMYGGNGNDLFNYVVGDGNDQIWGGAGASWTDTVSLSNGTASHMTMGSDWTIALTSGSVTTTDATNHVLTLSQDAAGTITMADGSTISFHEIERVTW